ncbi:diphthine--ammonia ligase [Halobacillus litoralis]|uniref:Dph6-related ATP pyrophosphatase n=1 Tax=Halobacillus litoralis TaxID=45668 RepID=UPI00248FB969|nr:diphthine--ammonia ligase [Halobacillus litoralis]
MSEKVIVSWSGGKDSALALHRMIEDRRYEVKGLISTTSETTGRLPIHEVKTTWLRKQADAVGLPLYEVPVPPDASNVIYENKLKEQWHTFKKEGIDTIVYADLFLEDIRKYRDQLLTKGGMKGHYPLWGKGTAKVTEDIIQLGYEALLTTVDTEVLDHKWLGHHYDRHFLTSISAEIDQCGEHGEFHTFVFAGPIFQNSVPVKGGEVFETMEGRFAHVELKGRQSGL